MRKIAGGSNSGVLRIGLGAALLVVAACRVVVAQPPEPAQASSFRGLAQAPEANLFVGSAGMTIPIEVPPGRPNLTPRLALTYSSAGGPSPYGHGWDLPLGKIQRCGKAGVLPCNDDTFRNEFVLVLPGASVECSLDPTAVEGRRECIPKVEDAFTRIFHLVDSNSWEAWTRDGLRYVFGGVDEARTGSSFTDLWDPETCAYTYSWALTSVEDPHGNLMEIVYARGQNVLYPQLIRYGGNSGAPGHPFAIRFKWKWRTTDTPQSNIAGALTRIVQQLEAIRIEHPEDQQAIPQRRYEFSYESDGVGDPRVARRSFLSAVTLYGADNKVLARASDGMPASTMLHYQQLDAQDYGFNDQDLPSPFPPGLGVGAVPIWPNDRMVIGLRDMNGDGFPDLVDTRPCSPETLEWWVYFGGRDGFDTEITRWHIPEPGACQLELRQPPDFYTKTLYSTIDLDGDGWPDLVDARSNPWKVYKGRPGTAGPPWGFETNWIPWHSPVGTGVRETFTLVAGGDGYQEDTLDLTDRNGDGLPDLVKATGVWMNTGNGFESTPSFGAQVIGRRELNDDNIVNERAWLDINGDGLADLVRTVSQGLEVRLSYGYGLDQAGTWSLARQCSLGLNTIDSDLVDMNGDGLLDFVERCTWTDSDQNWQVSFNTGTSFAAALPWRSPYRYDGNLQDFDGDGLADLANWVIIENGNLLQMFRNAGGAWVPLPPDDEEAPGTFARMESAPQDALVTVEDGIGGSTDLEYRPSSQWYDADVLIDRIPMVLWTVTRIERQSGMAAGGVSSLTTRYDYQDSSFDGPTREFRGFGSVTRTAPNGVATTTIFEQDYATKGRVFSVTTDDPDTGLPMRETVNEWQCVDPETEGSVSCDAPGAWVRLAASRRFDYGANQQRRESFDLNEDWDAYGNITAVSSGGDGSDSVTTITEFVHEDTLGDAGERRYLVSKPSRISVSGPGEDEEKWFWYDGLAYAEIEKGDVTRTETRVSASKGTIPWCQLEPFKRCAVTTMQYDTLGNVTKIVDPAEYYDPQPHGTVTEYDAATKLYPTAITNPLGHRVESAYLPACGQLAWRTLPNDSARTQYQYDEFCRLVSVTLPGQSFPRTEYDYYIGAAGVATDVFIREREPHSPTGFLERDELYDSFGRRLQVQEPAVIEGQRHIIAKDTVLYNAHGSIAASRAPFTINQIFDNGAALYQPPPAGELSEFSYDDLGRLTEARHPDNTRRTADHSTVWQTKLRDECFNDPSCTGGEVIEMRDAFGRVVEKQWFEEGAATAEAKTRFTYDLAGRLLTSEQWDGSWASETEIQITYDSLGRKIELDDPDSGTWHYGYDLAGNLVYQNDPQTGQHIEFCYDEIGRVTKKFFRTGSSTYSGSATCQTGVPDVVYQYDGAGVSYGTGRLTYVSDPSGATHFNSFDAHGRPLWVTKDIIVNGQMERMSTFYGYDSVGHIGGILYPDGEMVEYGYDEAGRVRSVTSAGGPVYLHDLTYDIFGRPAQITHGNGPGGMGVSDVREYGEGTNQFRLERLTTARADGGGFPPSCPGGGGNAFLDLTYAYRPGGLVSQVNDAHQGCPKLNNHAVYGYDGLGRLVSVDGNTELNSDYDHDHFGNLMYDGGTTFIYSGSKPHQMRYLGDLDSDVGYSANGNRELKVQESYEYDHENRLTAINGGATSLAYDYSGRLVLKETASKVTRYFSDLFEYRVQNGYKVLTKYYFAGDLRIAMRETLDEPQILASPTSPRTTMLASIGGALPIESWPDGRSLFGLLLGAGFVIVLIVPTRGGRRAAGIVVRRGHAAAVAIVFFIGASPAGVWEGMGARPAWGSGGNPCSTCPTPTPGAPTLQFLHYHNDHLGSPQVLSDAEGNVVRHLRYTPYGRTRCRLSASLTSASRLQNYEFTGYEMDSSGLLYAGARWYDPELAQFMTPDPVPVFPSPYLYLGGEPMNDVDPNGATPASFGGSQANPFNNPYTPPPVIIVLPQFQLGVPGAMVEGITGVGVASQGMLLVATAPNEHVLLPPSLAMSFASPPLARLNQQSANVGYVHAADGAMLAAFALDGLQVGLDGASLWLDATGVGASVSWLPDLINAVVSFGRGDRRGARLSVVAMIPYVGMAGNAGRIAVKALPNPKVSDAKLARLVDDLYKGAKGPNPIGTGSTADAVRSEIATGLPTFGKFHSQKAQEYLTALSRWLNKNPNAADHDRLVAETLKRDLQSALRGD